MQIANTFWHGMRHPGLCWALIGFLCIRAAIWLTAWFTVPDPAELGPGRWWSEVPLVRWDSAFYRCILRDGYPPGPPVPPTVEFFPVYPLLARPLALVVQRDVALVAVSNLAALIGAGFVYAWARRLTDRRTGFWCVMLASAYPAAMFLSAGYTEGLFFLEVATALWLLARGRPLPAACVSAVATATRPTGLALAAVILVWTYLHARAHTRSRPGPRAWTRRVMHLLAVGGVPVSGFVAYQAYLWHRYGRRDASFAVQEYWRKKDVEHPLVQTLLLQPVLERSARPIKYLVRGQFGLLAEMGNYNALLGTLILALGIKGLIRPGEIPRVLFLLPVGIFVMAYLPDPAGGGYLVSIARYQTAALPCFLLLARWKLWQRRPLALYALFALLVALQCLYARAFANWEWAG